MTEKIFLATLQNQNRMLEILGYQSAVDGHFLKPVYSKKLSTIEEEVTNALDSDTHLKSSDSIIHIDRTRNIVLAYGTRKQFIVADLETTEVIHRIDTTYDMLVGNMYKHGWEYDGRYFYCTIQRSSTTEGFLLIDTVGGTATHKSTFSASTLYFDSEKWHFDKSTGYLYCPSGGVVYLMKNPTVTLNAAASTEVVVSGPNGFSIYSMYIKGDFLYIIGHDNSGYLVVRKLNKHTLVTSATLNTGLSISNTGIITYQTWEKDDNTIYLRRTASGITYTVNLTTLEMITYFNLPGVRCDYDKATDTFDCLTSDSRIKYNAATKRQLEKIPFTPPVTGASVNELRLVDFSIYKQEIRILNQNSVSQTTLYTVDNYYEIQGYKEVKA